MIYVWVCLSSVWLITSNYVLPQSLLCTETMHPCGWDLLICGWINPENVPAILCLTHFYFYKTEIKSHEAIWEKERQTSTARFLFYFFQYLLILSVLLIFAHLSTLTTLCCSYCMFQKSTITLYSDTRQQTWERKAAADCMDRCCRLGLNQTSHKLCCPLPYSMWENLLLLNSGI